MDIIYLLFIQILLLNIISKKPVIAMKNIKPTESFREKCHQKRRMPRVIRLRIIFTEIIKSTELP